MNKKRMVFRQHFIDGSLPLMISDIAELVRAKVITPKEAREMLFEWEK